MAGKTRRKTAGKSKHIGTSRSSKTRSKAQEQSLKSKTEIDSTAKELSELDKELFTIKINDLEEIVSRKMHLCKYLEEEKEFFEKECESLKLLKKESMNILDKAYQEFSFELELLNDELNKLEDGFSETMKTERTDLEMTQRLISLSRTQSRLEKKLMGATRDVQEISHLESKLETLDGEINQRNNDQKRKISLLGSEFVDFFKRLEEKMVSIVNDIIKDKELKLHFLPVPYQALFMSGELGNTWCKSMLESCENLVHQNLEMKKKLQEVNVRNTKIHGDISEALVSVILSEQVGIQKYETSEDSKEQKETQSLVLEQSQAHIMYIEQLEKLASELENKTEMLVETLTELEKSIAQQEALQFDSTKKSRMLQSVMFAKDIIIKEL